MDQVAHGSELTDLVGGESTLVLAGSLGGALLLICITALFWKEANMIKTKRKREGNGIVSGFGIGLCRLVLKETLQKMEYKHMSGFYSSVSAVMA